MTGSAPWRLVFRSNTPEGWNAPPYLVAPISKACCAYTAMKAHALHRPEDFLCLEGPHGTLAMVAPTRADEGTADEGTVVGGGRWHPPIILEHTELADETSQLLLTLYVIGSGRLLQRVKALWNLPGDCARWLAADAPDLLSPISSKCTR